MGIIIRRAGWADASKLHEVAALTFALACPPGTPQSDVDDFVARHLSVTSFEGYLKDDRRIVHLAEDEDGTPVGYSMLVDGPIADPDVSRVVAAEASIELSKFYVLLDRHGSGVSSRLMAATLEAAAATGRPVCWLGVNQQNARAARFYEKSGFAVAGTKRFKVGEQWHDDHVRVRQLP